MSSTRTLRSTRQSTATQGQELAHIEKENGGVIVNGVHPNSAARTRAKTQAKVYCSCRQADDGSPMIHCSQCSEWYHFKCLQLDTRDAEDIRLYVCPHCTENTGLHTVLEWEGPEALEHVDGHIDPILLKADHERQQHLASVKREEEPEEPAESSDDGSEDDYVAEEPKKAKRKRRADVPASDSDSESGRDSKPRATQRLARRQSTASASASNINPKARSVSGSPGPSKRRKSTSGAQPMAKRKRSESNAGEDAARKYCSMKLQETFVEVFLKYPMLHNEHAEGDAELTVEKPREELTEEEKQSLQERAKRFSDELEECIFDSYAEPDPKTGKHVVGMKYKERFRMLTFNLSKPDRIALHKRIASSRITPQELSTMSSTDLADEETQQSIRQAEREALAHSILKKTSLPTAKMTHKGIQDIEDVSGGLGRERERERQWQQEEEDRIERERLERLKRAQAQAQQAAASGGPVPPDSPVSPIAPGWGRPPLHPLFIHPASDAVVASPVEQELNLADLINIDEEPGQEVSISLADPVIPPINDSVPDSSTQSGAAEATPLSPPPMSATGLSPFAARSAHPDFAPRPSFDLNAIWSTNESDDKGADSEMRNDEAGEEPVQEQGTRPASPIGVEDGGGGADDQDFDMFLEGGEEEMATEAEAPQPEPPEAVQANFEASPRVWTGKISMPLDSAIPQEVSVHAQQLGGRTLGGESLLWRTLFPTDHLRIDGRVPVDKSAQYLTQMRLNPHKELIAVAFSPETEASAASFDMLSKYLIDKTRHGLVFPWGNRPKEHHPGRELYIVPLQCTDPVPDFLELLDELKLPKSRSVNYMIGVWVLNKGKLVAPPAPPPPTPAAPPNAADPLPPSIASLASSLLPLSVELPANVSAAALAAEMASLTPEQIQLMLRTLASSSAVSQPPLPPPLAAAVPSMPPVPPGVLQPWMGPQAGYPPPPPFLHAPSPPHNAPAGPSYHPPPPPPSGPYDQERSPHSYQDGPHYDSYDRGGERGYRGRGSGRNRDRPQERQRDSGWRGRARGRGNQPGPSRGRQWGGSPQW